MTSNKNKQQGKKGRGYDETVHISGQIVNKVMKRHLPLIVIKEIKIDIIYHFTHQFKKMKKFDEVKY